MEKLLKWLGLRQQAKIDSLRFFHLLLALMLVSELYGCSNSSNSGSNLIFSANATPIGKIKPTSDNQATVYIQGKVEKEAPLIKQKAYQINDSTGKIWVVTHQNNLKMGQQVIFKGKVRYQSIPLADQEYGEVYLEEE
ncbi:hypothetical protein [Anabaena sp. PCC 7108]|uniref:hypothetical protein n=1 Tax=Anabaena sp. PCC 7108 TaxID=163908 RepID=UPI0003448DB6|nr:hypothetical protein [Anabaena sp. PCC 7108]